MITKLANVQPVRNLSQQQPNHSGPQFIMAISKGGLFKTTNQATHPGTSTGASEQGAGGHWVGLDYVPTSDNTKLGQISNCGWPQGTVQCFPQLRSQQSNPELRSRVGTPPSEGIKTAVLFALFLSRRCAYEIAHFIFP